MSTWTFPVMLKLTRPPRTAGEAQSLAQRIEECLAEEFDGELSDTEGVIALQPHEGVHNFTSTRRETD